MNQGGWWIEYTAGPYADPAKSKLTTNVPAIQSRAPSRLADFHALDKSAQRVILEIEVGLRDD